MNGADVKVIGCIFSSGCVPFILLTFTRPSILMSGSNAVVDNPIGELSNGGDVSNGGQHNSLLSVVLAKVNTDSLLVPFCSMLSTNAVVVAPKLINLR